MKTQNYWLDLLGIKALKYKKHHKVNWSKIIEFYFYFKNMQ